MIRKLLHLFRHKKDMSIKEAVECLTKAVKADDGYAWAWHCNIVMYSVDEGCSHEIANRGADRFMQIMFGVRTAGGPYDQKVSSHIQT